MKSVLGLDLSKSSAGWALWDGESDKARLGHRALGSGVLTDHGTTFARVHGLMSDLHKISPFEAVFIEKPLDPQLMAKMQDFYTPFLLYGLTAHALSFCSAKSIRKVALVHQATWRKHYLGRMKIGTKKADLKALARERCSQLGHESQNADEADAHGVLDYGLETLGITPPWRANEVLRPPLGRV